ncbi:MAG TPA: hypothetical protein VM759_05030 [Longimicrobium sp.]|nr:hypothetical protein [Longimicrobium sp.]
MKVRLSLEALDVTSFSVTPEPVPVEGGPESGDQVQTTPAISIPITFVITATVP